MKKYFTIIVLASVTIFSSCEKTKTYKVETTINDDINLFIWEGLNTYYLWQEDVPDLADNRFANDDDLYVYFRGYEAPENVFESLLNDFGTIDRFSWIVDDYIALENSFQGINFSNGMEFGLVQNRDGSNNLFGYVRYIVPNSDAATKSVTRGMIFNSINNTPLTISNYNSLLFGSNTSYTVGFADYNNGNPIANGNSVSLNKTDLEENPIAIAKVITEGTKKIGYLMYNQFASNYNTQLNAVFADFKTEGVNELIIDLRYNGGGSVNTATYLGGMVTGQFNGSLYSQEVWNSKFTAAFSADNFINNFTNQINHTDDDGNLISQEAINSLGLENVYFITSYSTASASELVINSLSSYINVNMVGTTTRGKQVGSVTLYDSDSFQKSGNNLNTNHTYAMQPLVLEISNKDNINYPNGLIPATTLPGAEIGEDYGNLGVLGEKSDPLLDSAITLITTGSKSSLKTNSTFNFKEVSNSKLATPASNNMYINLKK